MVEIIYGLIGIAIGCLIILSKPGKYVIEKIAKWLYNRLFLNL